MNYTESSNFLIIRMFSHARWLELGRIGIDVIGLIVLIRLIELLVVIVRVRLFKLIWRTILLVMVVVTLVKIIVVTLKLGDCSSVLSV